MAEDFPFDGRYTFIDTEVPNLNNNCICAISMIVVEERKEVLRHTELINPKSFFSPINISIHHIHQKDVRNARTILEFWNEYAPYFGKDYTIVAHNTLGDISVINKDLYRFHQQVEARTYLDTMDIVSMAYYQGVWQKGQLRLENIAKALDIALHPHEAESDVNACYEIIRVLHQRQGLDLSAFIHEIPSRYRHLPRENTLPSPAQCRSFFTEMKKKFAMRDRSVMITQQQAEMKGDRAWRNLDALQTIFYYELASLKKSRLPVVFLRLADTYSALGYPKKAVEVLETGLSRMNRKNDNYYSMVRALKKQRKIVQEKERQQETQALPAGKTSVPELDRKVEADSASSIKMAPPKGKCQAEQRNSPSRTRKAKKNRNRAKKKKAVRHPDTI